MADSGHTELSQPLVIYGHDQAPGVSVFAGGDGSSAARDASRINRIVVNKFIQTSATAIIAMVRSQPYTGIRFRRHPSNSELRSSAALRPRPYKRFQEADL